MSFDHFKLVFYGFQRSFVHFQLFRLRTPWRRPSCRERLGLLLELVGGVGCCDAGSDFYTYSQPGQPWHSGMAWGRPARVYAQVRYGSVQKTRTSKTHCRSNLLMAMMSFEHVREQCFAFGDMGSFKTGQHTYQWSHTKDLFQ